jgi:hypothetical protein
MLSTPSRQGRTYTYIDRHYRLLAILPKLLIEDRYTAIGSINPDTNKITNSPPMYFHLAEDIYQIKGLVNS